MSVNAEPLEIRLLGPMEVAHHGEALELPQSKKARALAAYLAMSGRPHRREKLCSLLWDVADDPRAALRWCLTKLRDVFDETAATRIAATRDTVAIVPELVRVDALELRAASAKGLSTLDPAGLERIAALVRGEFLEGLDLTDFHEFHAWLVSARAEAHRLHAAVLRELIARNASDPCGAIPWARTLVDIDPLDEDARVTLVRILAAAGRRGEAEQQVALTTRLFADLGIESPRRLQEAAPALLARPVVESASGIVSVEFAPSPPAPPSPTPGPKASSTIFPTRLVGRESELTTFDELLEATIASRHSRALLLSGEPGIGKSRLLAELGLKANDRGALILHGAAWEAERARPYVPWIDVLRCLPLNHAPETTRHRLACIVPELGPFDSGDEATRDQLFDAVSATVARALESAPAVLLVLDDVQWLDDASAELLHYVARSNRRFPLLIALAARAGDLPDNDGISRALRSLRRDPGILEIAVGPLSADETAQLVGSVVPASDQASLFSQSAGNPLFAIELARSAAASGTIAPATLDQLVRDRLARLAPDSESLLRWCAILGSSFDVRTLGLLIEEGEHLHESLELLERHALLVATDPARKAAYGFAHGVVHRVVYGGISAPRRTLMHAKVARLLAASSDRDGRVAEELERHASLGGDAETAARAAVAAGRRFLRVFANREAESIARRGLAHCEALDGRERAQRRLELMEIRIAARKPDRIDEIASEIEQAAEAALSFGCLEHARLGFHIVGYLRWETGRWADARRHLLRAEFISRSSDQRERVVAMAEAARCLLLLEKDLGHAEALVREASALAGEAEARSPAIPDALGMLRAHEGRYEEAGSCYREAIAAARREGDGAGLFTALEHLTMMNVDAGRYADAIETASDLGDIAEKLREGSECDFARAILAIARCGAGDDGQDPLIDAALAGLRNADAKHRLVWALNRAARGSMRRARWERARRFALDASRIAAELGHGSERIAALAALAAIAQATGDSSSAARFATEVATIPLESVSREARSAAETLGRPVASRPRRRE